MFFIHAFDGKDQGTLQNHNVILLNTIQRPVFVEWKHSSLRFLLNANKKVEQNLTIIGLLRAFMQNLVVYVFCSCYEVLQASRQAWLASDAGTHDYSTPCFNRLLKLWIYNRFCKELSRTVLEYFCFCQNRFSSYLLSKPI